MSAYDNVSGGSLKFKGSGSSGVKKKKKSKSHKDKLARAMRKDGDDGAAAAAAPSHVEMVTKTDAELKFEETQRKRQMERVSKAAVLTHKERVAEFNQKLEMLSEHHDIPKVGPG